MADWPDAAELKQVLDIGETDVWDDTLDRVLSAAIRQVKEDVGSWDEDDYEDEPDDKLAQAALRMAELMGTRPNADTNDLSRDPTYRTLLKGRRRRFGIS